MYTYMCVYACLYICMYIYMHVYMYEHIFMHANNVSIDCNNWVLVWICVESTRKK